jgi:hypothetical protein
MVEWMCSLLNAFLTSALDRGEWSASRPSRFTLKEHSIGIYEIGWVDVWVSLDAVEESNVSASARNQTPITSSSNL